MLRVVLQTLGKHHCITFGFISHCIIMISSEAIFSDAWLMAGGYFLMFGYTIAMLGRWNRVERNQHGYFDDNHLNLSHRIPDEHIQVRLYLSLAGIAGIGMGLLIAMGIR